MRCLEEQTIYEYAQGHLAADELAGVVEHADGCPACRELIARAVEDSRSQLGSSPTLPRVGGAVPEGLLRWERYRVLGALGSGGAGDVYRAYDPRLEREVAIKVLRSELAGRSERFLTEARAQARVQHPYVCKVYEVGTVDDRPFIAMQLVTGSTLWQAREQMDLAQRLQVMRQVAEALDAAHRLGIVHRDVKPSNVLVERDQDGGFRPYVTDFGLAREMERGNETSTGALVGTPAFMSPEQARPGTGIDRRTDVYALGATLYALLVGAPPFVAGTTFALLDQILHHEPPPPRRHDRAIPADVEVIVLKCLEKDPAQRYPSAAALADDLGRALRGEPIVARPATLSYRLRKAARRHRPMVAVGVVALAGFVALGAVGVEARWSAARRARLARELGEQSREIESYMRVQHLLPLHDLRPAYATVRARLRAIEEQVAAGGRAARAPGDYAVGRAHLELSEYEAARTHLQAAWDGGYREPSVAYALGRALSALYRNQRMEVETLAGPARARKQAEIEKTYRDPALAFLRLGAGAQLDAPALVEALIAYDEFRFDDAIARGEEAARQAPWLYEGIKLAGDADVMKALAADVRGGTGESAPLFAAAGRAYGRAIEIARSDDDLYAGECRRLSFSNELQLYAGRFDEAGVRAAVEMCEKVKVVDASVFEAPLREGYLYLAQGSYLANHGADPSPALLRARDVAEALAKVARPDQWQAQALLGRSYSMLANDYDLRRGIDAVPSLEKAIAAFGAASRLHPNTVNFGDLGDAYGGLGRARGQRGEEPLPAFADAVQAYRSAAALDDGTAEPAYLINLGMVLSDRAQYQATHSLDPRAAFDEALAALRRGIERQPKRTGAHNSLGNAFTYRAYWERAAGLDPRGSIDGAIAAYRRAAETDPTFLYAYDNIAECEVLAGTYELGRGGNPSAAIERARAVLQKCAGNDYMHWLWLGRAELLAARHARATGQRADEPARRARAAVTRALAGGAQDPDVHLAAAELARLDAEVRPSASRAALDAGLAAAARALAINPRSAAALAERGELLAAAARLPGGRAQAAAARAAFAEAVRIDVLVERVHRATLDALGR